MSNIPLKQWINHWPFLFILILNFTLCLLLVFIFLSECLIYSSLNKNSSLTMRPMKTIPNINLADLHLFGTFDSNVTMDLYAKWTIKGIILGEHKSNNLAILNTPQGEVIYKAGDHLPDGAVVTEIAEDKVLIKSHGFKNEIYLPWQEEPEVTEQAIDMPIPGNID